MNTQDENRSEPNLNERTIPPGPSPEEQHERLEKGPEVIVLRDLELILIAVLVFPVNADVAKHLESWGVTMGGSHSHLGSLRRRLPPAAPVPQGCGITCIPMMA